MDILAIYANVRIFLYSCSVVIARYQRYGSVALQSFTQTVYTIYNRCLTLIRCSLDLAKLYIIINKKFHAFNAMFHMCVCVYIMYA